MRKLALIGCLSMCLATTGLGQDNDLGPLGNAIVKPLVRVSTGSASGSGVIVYSEDRENSGEFQTYILTNHHVIDGAIHLKKTWDNLLQRYISTEENDLVTVEVFMYLRAGRTVIGSPLKASIVAYKEAEDLALLKLDYPVHCAHVATFLPAERTLLMGQGVWAVGCSIGADPMPTCGHITDLEVLIDHKPYIMASADIIYGNSGGAVFVADTSAPSGFYFVGVPARVSVLYNGQALTHMGYFIPITRIRKWLTSQRLSFLLDGKTTPTQSFKERDALRQRNKNSQP